MTILTLNRKELEKRIGRITPEVEEKITNMGTPIEEVRESEVSVEIFPNRPDLLSLENFARAFNQFNGKGKIAKFEINSSGEKLIVSKNVPGQWPYAISCIVKGIKFDDEKIKSVIDIQEKLGSSILRKRKKGGIGIYPLEKISFPIRFEARTSEKIIFRPLEFPRELNAKQILKQHPTGIEYADICKDWNKFPVFLDNKGKIMSMPPIINSHDLGRIDSSTRDVFVETTGNNLNSVIKAFNILIASLSEMGGRIYSMECIQKDGKKLKIPLMDMERMEFRIEDIEKTLGISLSEKKIRELLARMGLGFEESKGKSFALIPPYRTDILHWIDLTEEIAIAYGYKNFEAEIPQISTIGNEDSFEKTIKTMSNILCGLGLLETFSFHLTTKKDIKKMHFNYSDFIEVEDSKTARDVLRMDILTNLLQIFSENSDAAYPQKIFEMGKVFFRDTSNQFESGIKEGEKLAIALIDEKANFTELKQILDYFFKMLGISYSIENTENNNYISGRVGKILVNGKEIGFIGELAPRVIKNWKLKMPIVALEIDLRFMEK